MAHNSEIRPKDIQHWRFLIQYVQVVFIYIRAVKFCESLSECGCIGYRRKGLLRGCTVLCVRGFNRVHWKGGPWSSPKPGQEVLAPQGIFQKGVGWVTPIRSHSPQSRFPQEGRLPTQLLVPAQPKQLTQKQTGSCHLCFRNKWKHRTLSKKIKKENFLKIMIIKIRVHFRHFVKWGTCGGLSFGSEDWLI